MNKVTDTNTKFSKFLKPIYQKLIYSSGDSKIVMIFGAQRSGTTLISRTFDSFSNARVFGEFSELSNSCPLGLRLRPTQDIKDILSKVNAPLIVMKPLVESQNASFLLNEFPEATGIWVFRNYKDVAASALKQFKNTKGVGNLLPILNDEKGNWRNDALPDELRAIVSRVYRDDFSNFESACLFWYVRNYLFCSQGLDMHSRIKVWEYESLLKRPKHYFGSLGKELGVDLTRSKIFEDFSSNSVGKKNSPAIRDELNALCEQMLEKLKVESGKV